MKYFALIDCNNFFASCERLFRPDLKTKPVAVLSNNDGCIVARTNEVKALGVPMAAPYFKWEKVLNQAGAVIFSANFALYGDISRRVASILEEEAPEIEIYSIDESFVGLDMSLDNATAWAERVRARILKDIGIATSVGVAPSKTLAKAASEHVKKTMPESGVRAISQKPLDNKSDRELLVQLHVGAIWGVGLQLSKKLNSRGVYSALDLAGVSEKWAREQLTITGEKTVKELKGIACFGLNDRGGDGQKSMLVSRSFGQPVRNLSELEVAVASFCASLSHKLRQHNQLADGVTVFATSSRHRQDYRSIQSTAQFEVATNNVSVITKSVIEALASAFEPGVSYKRAGVYVGGLRGLEAQQLSLLQLDGAPTIDKQNRLSEALEALSSKFGKGAVKLAATMPKHTKTQKWTSRINMKSPEYTTKWNEIAVIKAKT